MLRASLHSWDCLQLASFGHAAFNCEAGIQQVERFEENEEVRYAFRGMALHLLATAARRQLALEGNRQERPESFCYSLKSLSHSISRARATKDRTALSGAILMAL